MLFRGLAVRATEDGVARANEVRWALGLVADGQTEVAGAWAMHGAMSWQDVFDDLSARGVEKIRFVVGAEPGASQAAFPLATVLDPVSPLLRSSGKGKALASGFGAFPGPELTLPATHGAVNTSADGGRDRLVGLAESDVLSAQQKRIVIAAGKAALHMQASLTRAVARHGPFESAAAAAAFVDTSLMKAEDRQRRHRLAQQRQVYLRAAAAA